MAKVLLVEDDNNLREIYEARLQAEGYEIAAAQDGEQALVVAKDFKPDLVISDVMMPKISGFEMLDILRNTEGLKNTRVIMLTALSQAEDKSRADQLGADRYLVKSQVTLEDIIKAAHDILGDGGEPATPVAPAPSPPPESPQSAPATDVSVTPAPAEPAAEPAAQPTPVAEPPKEDAAPSTAMDAIAQAVEPDATPSPAPVAADPTQTTDDKLLADAASSLTDSDAATPAAVETEAPTTPQPEPEQKDTSDEVSASSSSAGSSKRVIQPLDSGEAKPTLEELLAREEAKDITNGTVKPTVSEAPTATPGETNPHDIAL
jgi:CheY-like chemotaxis protein